MPAPTYLLNPAVDTEICRGARFRPEDVLKAAVLTSELLQSFEGLQINISEILGMRNLSAFVGELFASAMLRTRPGQYEKNPHQDGYPDLLLMDKTGKALWESLAGRRKDKKPFSPFATGGIEIKATCGAVPTPAKCEKQGRDKPGIGDQRLTLLQNYDWKAHHQDTNNLMGLFWDFIDGRPQIVAVFYSNRLSRADWGGIIQPKDGGGRTTSVSIMTPAGVKKMFGSWVLMLNDPAYIAFFERRNKTTFTRPRR